MVGVDPKNNPNKGVNIGAFLHQYVALNFIRNAAVAQHKHRWHTYLLHTTLHPGFNPS
ncbi:uncharacterized protein DS421_20g683090 [Arachis hypogaea]|nr:uncharacterized protein DS421_20g683090 [Arachis hypogaea]